MVYSYCFASEGMIDTMRINQNWVSNVINLTSINLILPPLKEVDLIIFQLRSLTVCIKNLSLKDQINIV